MNKKIPIIILHGWNLSGETFDPLKKILVSKGWKTYSPTMPGFIGGPNIDRPYYLNDYINYVLEFMSNEKIDKAIIIGHSFGGRVAIKLSSVNSDKVAALILTGAPGYSSTPRYKLFIKVLGAKIGSLLLSNNLSDKNKNKIRNFYYKLLRIKDYTKANPIMRFTFRYVVSERLDTYMKKIKCNTILVWGAQDKLVPVGIAQKMTKVITGSNLIVIPDADHAVPYKEPEKFYSSIENFLNNNKN